MHRFFLSAVFLAVSGAAWGQSAPATAPSAPSSDADIIIEMARLASPDRSTSDPGQQLLDLLANIQKLPPLLEQLEKEHPASQYLPDAYSLVLNAMVTARQFDPKSFTDEQIGQTAAKLTAAARKEEHRAQGQFVMLQVQGLNMIKATSRPATSQAASMPGGETPATRAAQPSSTRAAQPSSAATTSAPASMPASVPATMPSGPFAELAQKFIGFAKEYSHTPYASQALLQAAGLYLEANYDQAATDALERLAKEYPKEPSTMTGLIILARLSEQNGQADKAMQAKKLLVQQFPDSAVAFKYKAEVARQTVVGKTFVFRGKSVAQKPSAGAGKEFDIKELAGKPVLVYFFAAITPRTLTEGAIKNLRELNALTGQKGYALIAIGAEPDFSTKAIADILKRNELDVPLFLDPEGGLATTYGVSALPSVIVLDKDAKVRDVLTATDIVQQVREYFAAQ